MAERRAGRAGPLRPRPTAPPVEPEDLRQMTRPLPAKPPSPGRLPALLAAAGLALVLVVLPEAPLPAQEPAPVLHYSRITGGFDALPPIGERFGIAGSVDPGVVAVEVRSWGFPGRVPRGFRSGETRELCEAIDIARSRAEARTVVPARLAWERPESGEGAPASRFTVTHPRLYYGRSYAFVFTYFRPLDTAAYRERVTEVLVRSLEGLVDRAAESGGLTPGEIDVGLGEARSELEAVLAGRSSCPYRQVDRRTGLPADLWELFPEDSLFSVLAPELQRTLDAELLREGIREARLAYAGVGDNLASLRRTVTVLEEAVAEEEWDRARELFSRLAGLASEEVEAELPLDTLGALLEAAATGTGEARAEAVAGLEARSGFPGRLGEALLRGADAVETAFADGGWREEEAAAESLFRAAAGLLGRFRADTQPRRVLDELLGALAKVRNGLPGIPGEGRLEAMVSGAVSGLELPGYDRVISATYARPYLETMDERHPFLVSLDGGLLYVGSFDAITPAVAANIKLNRVDFDDPYDRTPELSVLVGLTTSAPDDLDPDYAGIFSETGDAALLLGLGVRLPAVSPLLRFQGGTLVYRQQPENPLVDDLDTEFGGYVGVSLNWDTLDFLSGLFGGRSALDLGGG